MSRDLTFSTLDPFAASAPTSHVHQQGREQGWKLREGALHQDPTAWLCAKRPVEGASSVGASESPVDEERCRLGTRTRFGLQQIERSSNG